MPDTRLEAVRVLLSICGPAGMDGDDIGDDDDDEEGLRQRLGPGWRVR